MGKHQVYRGDPTQKQYYVLNNFSGGVNKVAIDDYIPDYMFRDLVNMDLDTMGMIKNRKGFGDVVILTELLDFYSLTFSTGKYNLFKVIESTNSILSNIISNENYTIQWVESDIDYWTDNGEVDGNYDESVLTEPDDDFYSVLTTPTEINVAGRVYDQEDLDYHYYRSIYLFSGSLKILIIEDNHIKLLAYNGTTLSLTTILISTKELPSVSSYKDNFIGVNVVEYVDNLYISLNDISEYYKGILIYNKDDNTWTTWKGQYNNFGTWTNFDSALSTSVYKPKPYDISNISSVSSLTQGFNVLANAPLLYIDDQEIGLPTIRSIILTDTTTGDYLDKIPSSGDFTINVIKTGSTEFMPEDLQIIFKDEDNNFLDYKIGIATSGGYVTGKYGGFTGVYGIDNGGYFSYIICDLDVSSSSYILIDIKYKNNYIDWSTGVYTSLVSSSNFLGIADNDFLSVKNENYTYKKLAGNYGRKLSDYQKIELQTNIVVDDVSSAVPADLFSGYIATSSYNSKYFQSYDTNGNVRLWVLAGAPSSAVFTEQTMYENVLFDTWKNFVPLNGTYIKIQCSEVDDMPGGTPVSYTGYAMLRSLETSLTSTHILQKSEIKNVSFDTIVTELSGQYFEISNDDPEDLITGIDLENVKLVTISDKLIYYNGNTIYFSNIYQFSYIPNYAFLILPLLSTDEIISVNYFKGSWIIFTKYSIWKMKGTYGDADWSVQQINNVIGCIAPKTIRSIDNTLYFVSDNGLYRLVQNYYLDGLENVSKIDKNIPSVIPKTGLTSVYYNDQYILYFENDETYDVMRLYNNIDLPEKQHPIVFDKFAVIPNNVFKNDWFLFSIKNGKLYVYDQGYTDFLPTSSTDNTDYIYNAKLVTSRLNFGYPTHDKKIKSIYIKTYYNGTSTLYLTGLVDDFIVVDPNTYIVTVNDDGELIYTEYNDPELDNNLNFELKIGSLGSYELGDTPLGDSPYTTHKVVVGSKGKNIQLMVEHRSNSNFGIVSIGYVYKLGKVKERA